MKSQRYLGQFLGAIVLLFHVNAVHGQEALDLTLDRCIEKAQKKSPAAEVARLQFEQALWGYRSHKAEYLPSLTLNGDAPGLTRSINQITQDDGTIIYLEQSRLSSSLRLSLSQFLPMTGGQISVASELSRIDEFGDNDFLQWQSTPLIVRLTQPLFRFNSMRWDRRTEPLRMRIARREFLENMEGLAVDITGRFFDVYISQVRMENARFNVTVNDSIHTLSRGRYDVGKISENDFLQSELALVNAQLDLSRSEIEYQDALQQLRIDLDLPATTDLEITPPQRIPVFEVDPDAAITQARLNGSAHLRMEMDELEAEREVDRLEGEGGFSADLVASYGLNQTAESIDEVYRDPLNNQRLNVGFRVPLWVWGRDKARVQAAKAVRGRVERNNGLARRELDHAVYSEVIRFEQLGRQLLASAKADTIAGRHFEVARNRYLIGKIDITSLFDAQREKDSARRAYIESLKEYWVSYRQLRRLTLFDFVEGRPLAPPGN